MPRATRGLRRSGAVAVWAAVTVTVIAMLSAAGVASAARYQLVRARRSPLDVVRRR